MRRYSVFVVAVLTTGFVWAGTSYTNFDVADFSVDYGAPLVQVGDCMIGPWTFLDKVTLVGAAGVSNGRAVLRTPQAAPYAGALGTIEPKFLIDGNTIPYTQDWEARRPSISPS